jgi:hypothetical protein
VLATSGRAYWQRWRSQANAIAVQSLQSNDASAAVWYEYAMVLRSFGGCFGGGGIVDPWRLGGVDRGT